MRRRGAGRARGEALWVSGSARRPAPPTCPPEFLQQQHGRRLSGEPGAAALQTSGTWAAAAARAARLGVSVRPAPARELPSRRGRAWVSEEPGGRAAPKGGGRRGRARARSLLRGPRRPRSPTSARESEGLAAGGDSGSAAFPSSRASCPGAAAVPLAWRSGRREGGGTHGAEGSGRGPPGRQRRARVCQARAVARRRPEPAGSEAASLTRRGRRRPCAPAPGREARCPQRLRPPPWNGLTGLSCRPRLVVAMGGPAAWKRRPQVSSLQASALGVSPGACTYCRRFGEEKGGGR